MLYPTFLTLAAFIVSLIGTKLLIGRLRGSAVFSDIPNDRSSHTTPTPKGGGIAVVTTLFIYLLATDTSHYAILLVMLLLAAISLLDDLVTINPLARLLSHALGVAIALYSLDIQLRSGYLPPWLDLAVLGIAWVWFINLFNFMDGIDSITTSETASITTGIALILAFSGMFESGIAFEAMIVLGAVCGFWWWNRHPAKIFLGDVGSVPLGFIVGYLLISFADAGFIAAAIILPAYYIMDATVTLLRRAWERKPIFSAHREHFYQQAAHQIGHHGIVTHLIVGLNLLLIALAHFSVMFPELYWLCILLAYGASGIWCLTFSQISKHIGQIRRNIK